MNVNDNNGFVNYEANLLSEPNEKKGKARITSIDALRAVALLGILLIHATDEFSWGPLAITTIGGHIKHFLPMLLRNRCNTVFGMLFGVSFYLILRNPSYSSRKFVWRCFLLFLFGLFNKVFYTYDALMWYGLSGMVLVLFRRLSSKKLWISFFLIYIINVLISNFVDLKLLFFGSVESCNRYVESAGLGSVIRYPIWLAALDYVKLVIDGPLGTLSKFLLGYCIAKTGIIDNLQKYVNLKYSIVLSAIYVVLFVLGAHFNIPRLLLISYLFGSLCYAEWFLLVYYKTYPLLRFLEPYGKLGMTNYSMQSIVGVIIIGLVFIPRHLSFECFFMTMILFYFVQLVFSILWLKYYKYGPFEWLWRCLTERRWITNKIKE